MKECKIDREKAKTIALQALVFLAKDDALLKRFLDSSGLTPQELKNRFRDDDLLGGVLDEILRDDAVLLAFCKTASLSPDTLIKARRALPGGYESEE